VLASIIAVPLRSLPLANYASVFAKAGQGF